MKLNASLIIILLAFSLFCGVFVISLGIGSEFTTVNTVMSPLVCGTDKVQAAWEYNVAHPGQIFFGSHWLCVDETTGTAQEASIKTTLISGVVYGLLLFAIVIFWALWMRRPSQNRQ